MECGLAMSMPAYRGRKNTSVQPPSSLHTLSLRGVDNPASGITLADSASRHVAEWFHRSPEKRCFIRANYLFFRGSAELSILNARFLPAIVVEEKTRVFCDSALLSQHTTFEFDGGAPGHALHSARYPKLSNSLYLPLHA
jgi:hypothetical protein